MTASPAPGARARARAEITGEILEVARRHLATHGAAGLSLRAVAREIGMVSSAVYRYFPSRDALLTQLIVEAYDGVGDAAEAAEAATQGRPATHRIVAVWLAVRRWALEHPHEYALVYGTPVPGYAAPTDTIAPAERAALVMLRILSTGVADGSISTDDRIETTRSVRRDLAALRELAPGTPDAVLSRGLAAWTQLFGAISLEMFGHFHNVIDDGEAFFDLQARRVADYVARGASPAR